ncbi:MAG: hypothetical protein ACK42D_01395 [Candidatus Paceibacteria bacterium]
MFRITTGLIITGAGLILLIMGIMGYGASLIISVIVTAIGVAILLNKREDEIEQIKNDKNNNHD